jgi:hypothetical protein
MTRFQSINQSYIWRLRWSYLSRWTFGKGYLHFDMTVKMGYEQNFATKYIISTCPLWTFYYVAIFQQHLYLGHIPLSLYDIPEFVVPISIPLTDGLANQETTEGRALGG